MTFTDWWNIYWQNRTNTAEHDLARAIAHDAWWAGRDQYRFEVGR